jgi:hypothetical protein
MHAFEFSLLLIVVVAQSDALSVLEVQKALKDNGATVKEYSLYRTLLHDKNTGFTAKGDFGVTIEKSWTGGKEKLAILKGQPSLKEVNFDDAPDEFLDILDDLTQLEGIYFSGKQTTDKGLDRLKKHKNLIALSLCNTSITDKTLSNIAHMKKLRCLSLCLTDVTDGGLKHLAGLENLEVLNLDGTNTTDAGLLHLRGLKKLRRLRAASGDLLKDK